MLVSWDPFSFAGDLTPTEVTQVTTPESESDNKYVYKFFNHAITMADYYCCDRAQGLCRETCKKVRSSPLNGDSDNSLCFVLQELPLNDQSVAIQKVIAVCGPPPEVRTMKWGCKFRVQTSNQHHWGKLLP